MTRARVVGFVLLAVVAVVLVLQNTAEVETRVLFFSIRAPRAVLLTATLLIGFALGVLATWHYGRSKQKP